MRKFFLILLFIFPFVSFASSYSKTNYGSYYLGSDEFPLDTGLYYKFTCSGGVPYCIQDWGGGGVSCSNVSAWWMGDCVSLGSNEYYCEGKKDSNVWSSGAGGKISDSSDNTLNCGSTVLFEDYVVSSGEPEVNIATTSINMICTVNGATTTCNVAPIVGNLSFLITIIIVCLFLMVVGFLYNTLFNPDNVKRKPWKR